ncbi:uncharacterized protein A1O9_11270 [Exophiala aquamarina CBS 119918]|uniref:LIM zinc-binding domain-containing protein n=1 Tax=Exophiala aquamarina CBS 119918 TaxID=1182545 RepID=A0A072P0R8_9EURO|nr:uncharacterized protein A1O9_11270 [Exophiala aquamarina CBS 119918]KEF52853.1 hypothetical protein A1O9_11270 [Exophiala aquamarina CBS 119918]
MPPRSPPFGSKYSHVFSASYLERLRNSRPARPTGSRPPPFASRHHASLSSQFNLTRSDSAPTVSSRSEDSEDQPFAPGQAPPPMPKSVSFTSTTTKGRPLAQPSSTGERPVVLGRKVSPTAIVQLPHTSLDEDYLESTARQLEKEEAQSLRQALETIDQKDEEQRIYSAAQDEAADLVWKHRNPKAAEEEKTAPYVNPDLKKGRRRSSGQRQASGSRKVSFPSAQDQIYEEPLQKEPVIEAPVKTPQADLPLRLKSTNTLPWLRKKAPEKTEPALIQDPRKYDMFEMHRNPRIRSNNAEYTFNTPPPTASAEPIHEVDTPKSTTSLEIRSEDIRAATSMKRKDRSPNLPTPTAVSDRPGRPIVSFDKTWKPPTDSPRTSQDLDRAVIKMTESPSIASSGDRPLPRPLPKMPEVTVSAPTVPTINLPKPESTSQSGVPVPMVTVSGSAVPTISISEGGPGIPTINVEADRGTPPTPLPSINLPGEINHSPRPLPRHSATVPVPSQPHKTPSTRIPWLNRGAMPTVSCSSCTLPISGRIVTASGSASSSPKARFHPECFSCYHCSTPLECVSFYPEPDNKRVERLQNEGIDPDSVEGCNDALRFYCHLDYHEFFSPRCRSCKTPIEGEVIVAAGAEWHVGHFFCAECGDPFDSNTPFVERDNYAYCVRCHTRRTSARCRRCRNQILDELTVEALGGKYHEQCFNCFECGGGFGEEGRFFVRNIQIEPTDKEKRKGITRKMEEKPVCGSCEERRLKA